MTTRDVQRLWDPRAALDQPEALAVAGVILGLLAVTPVVILAATRLGSVDGGLRVELWRRWRSWLVIVALLVGPILAGSAYTAVLFMVLGLLCYREFARATGLFRERLTSGTVAVGIVLIHFAAIDHYYAFFVALFPLTVGAIALVSLLPDRPDGYLQRTALGVLGFCLFGVSLGHLAYFANDWDYRGTLLWLLLAVQLNDVFAFCCGKLIGRRKLAPRTSPNKTLGGAVGAVVLTTLTMTPLAWLIFSRQDDPQPAAWPHPVVLAAGLSVLGQAGDLLVSSVKRDLGLKDLGRVLPGHGGLLDRFDSLVLTAPAVFHYIGALRGLGLGETTRVFTDGWWP
jgi:phosphatidate cytidylyltransferase